MSDMFMRDLTVKVPANEELTRERLRSLNLRMRTELSLCESWREYLISVPKELSIEMVAQKLGCPVENIKETEGYKKVG